MFNALADAQDKAVPVVRNRSVRVERDGEAVVEGRSSAGTGYREYAVVVVSTIKTESLGFERARRVVSRRRSDWEGRDEESVESCEEASGGINGSGSNTVDAPDVSRVSCFNRFRRRCGSSSILISVEGTCSGEPVPRSATPFMRSTSMRENTSLPPFLPGKVLMEPLALKYSLRKSPRRGILSIRASLDGPDAENTRLGTLGRDLEDFSKHRKHTVS